MKNLFTSESISVGHPDALVDFVCDAILTDILKHDKKAHVGLEGLVTKNLFVLSGEVSSDYSPNYEKITREVVKEIGYTKPEYGFCWDTFKFVNRVNTQSPDIAQGVDLSEDEVGAGDIGIMFGFANNETEHFYPLAATLANTMVNKYARFFKGDPNFRPDAKAQVTIDYTNGLIDTVVFSASHEPEVSQEYVKQAVIENVIKPSLSAFVSPETFKNTKILVNTTGRFVVCGPEGDCGVSGRKLVVDSYGGYARIGGGNQHGKCPSKVDASAARAARYIAKNLVAAGVCEQVEIQLAYAIGQPKPVSINVDSRGTSVIPDVEIAEYIDKNIDLSVAGIIKNLHLLETDYTYVSKYKQFGHKADILKEGDNEIYIFPWESLDLVEQFKADLLS